MTTPPVVSITDELIADIQRDFDRNGPCPHENWSQLGAGHFIHCDDCGSTVEASRLSVAVAAAERHYGLSMALRAIFAERAALKQQLAAASVDADRYRWLRSPEAWNGFQLVMEKGGVDLDAAIDAARNTGSGD